MDGIPESRIERSIFNALRVCCRKLMWSEAGKVCCKTAPMRCWYFWFNKIPVDRAFDILNFLAKKYNEKRAKYVTCLSFRDCWVKGNKGFKREYYLDTKRAAFENIEMNIPRKEKELLVTLYGEDYMTPPPLKERETHIPASDFQF